MDSKTPVDEDSPSQDTPRGPAAVSRVSTARRWAALLALALGGFGIGVTEFATLGLIPDLASDLLPDAYSADPASANATAGILVSVYALGVVVGAPTITALAARVSRKRLLLVLLGVFVVGNLLSAVLPSFGLVMAARFVSGIPHGAYFGVASLVAASLMGPGKRAMGVSLVLSGLTVANIVGVPLGTFVGQTFGWRTTYLMVTLIFAVTLVFVLIAVPFRRGDPTATVKNELSAFRRPLVWLTLLMGSVGFGGMFAVYTYVTPLTTDVTGLDASFVPIVLVVFGVGMTVGNLLGGWFTDHGVKRSLIVAMGGLGLSVLALGLTSASPVGLIASILFVGFFVGGAGPAVQTRLMDVSRDAQSVAAALNHSALNIGNSLGAYLGGLVIAAGLGYTSPAFVGVALATAGILVALISFAVERRRGR
ncbi:arabinose ABC transporter permease [Cnuibacter physcomitrellae]|uniref:Arabinose ABC transporter permease n=1 Tax=Cnuibacter physcomitrellae TaxID=1619308 RepID=A0A1X9LTF6_9MICO|nr:arabinose ABC transporter permease [Cnuibacter physcomitrellae]